MWSLGCILFELFSYQVLFKSENEYELLRKIIKIKGAPTKQYIEKGNLNKL